MKLSYRTVLQTVGDYISRRTVSTRLIKTNVLVKRVHSTYDERPGRQQLSPEGAIMRRARVAGPDRARGRAGDAAPHTLAYLDFHPESTSHAPARRLSRDALYPVIVYSVIPRGGV